MITFSPEQLAALDKAIKILPRGKFTIIKQDQPMIMAKSNSRAGSLVCQGFGVKDRSQDFGAICDILNTVREATHDH